ncbi:hypothetical protein PU629_17755 [Pullulanibacillus sp. KACC 23026]|uniref:hypothetical protein n=1 Tax=Pullulanibacillus sp. KACC 23026 TaxID=3028315 RepID=UPI0023AEC543|nr:hypothetical protein [Pullulanibacillus sp. KACC 23026]WEG11952.1 hypothetical protein PU629_17755 [Pullulanibacillus sp. KACC 23026]
MKKKELIFLFSIMIIAILYAGWHEGFLTHAPTKKTVQSTTANPTSSQTASTQKATSKSTKAATAKTKVKTTLAVDDPLLSCSTDQYVCEKAVLASNEEYSYSDYIWANAGDTITFGGETTGNSSFSLWIESEDGSFSSDVNDVKEGSKGEFTLEAPFDGNFRVVLQHQKNDSAVNAYIKDPWSD